MDFSNCFYDEQKKIWSSPGVPSIYNLECSIGRILHNQMKSFPNEICQIDDTANITLKTYEALTWGIRIAQHFHQMDLKQDDIIGFVAKNTTYVLPAVLGCFFNCTPFHAVNPVMDEATLKHCFDLTKPTLIFCDGDNYEKIKLATNAYKPKIYTLSEHLEEIPKVIDLLEPTKTELFYQPKNYAIGSHQTVAILCSSGTTGKPKAVCISAANLIYDIQFITSENILYLPSGIDWITGLSFLIISCMTGCTRIITNKPFGVDQFLDLVQKYKITNTFMPPRNMAALVNHPRASKEILSSLQIVQCGGSIVSEKLVKDLKSLLNDNALVLYGYGLTEFGGISVNINCDQGVAAGKIMPKVQLRILDDGGNNLGPNEVGEICVYNGKHWNGYYGNPQETLQIKDVENWFHTGDLGYVDDEKNLYIIDRKKDIRKYLGLHFWPTEIEEAIAELPDVLDVCVVTIEDVTKGDCAGALVVKNPNSPLTDVDIIEYVKDSLVVIHKQIHAGVYFVDSIPQNANGKMMRSEAKKILESLVDRNLVN